MFRPFGNLVRLPDGRTLRKQANGVWIDVNSGVKMNDTMVGNLMYSSVFYGVPDGGVGKDTPRWVVGVAGSFTITNWLNDAKNGTDSIDFGWIGDSNTIRCNINDGCWRGDPQGLVDHFMTAGISAGIKIYGSPIQTVANGNASGYKTYSNALDVTLTGRGWTSGVSKGEPSYSSEWSAGGGRFTPNYDSVGSLNTFGRDGYAWLPDGKTGYANNLIIECTGGFSNIGLTPPLTLRLIAGTTGNTGGILPIFFVNAANATTRVANVAVTFTGGFTGYNIDLPSSAYGNTGVSVYFSGQNAPGFFATGPVGMALNSVFTKTDKGMASSLLFGSPGITLGGIYTGLTLASSFNSNKTITNMLKEFHIRQKVAGGTGRVCIAICSGVNLDNGSNNAEIIANTEEYTKNIASIITSEWATAGLPADKLTFLVFNTWTGEPSSTWSTILPTIVTDLKLYANDRSKNITYVDILTFAGTYAGLTAAGYYDQTSNTKGTAHLSNGLTGGYHYVSNNIFTALLKQRNTNK